MLELKADESLPEIRFSTLRDYFAAVEAEPAYASLPVLRRELNGVFRGCYSSQGDIKRFHRLGESLLFRAEACQHLSACPEPARLRSAWDEFLFNQFHDILAGTCTAPNAPETFERLGFTLTHARQSIQQSVFSLARRVDTSGETGSVLFAANPLPWPRRVLVSFDTFKIPHGELEITHLEAPDGRVIPLQWQHADANLGPWGLPWAKLTAVVDLPPSGYRVFRIAGRPAVRAADNSFEAQAAAAAGQQFVRHSESPRTETSEVRKTPEKAVPFMLRVIRDRSGAWGHDIRSFQEEIGRPDLVDTRVLEDGPLLCTVRRTYRWDRSEIWVDTVSFAHTEDVELRVRLNWQQKREMLKLSFGTGLGEARVVTRGAGGLVIRPPTGNEEPCGHWLALESVEGSFIVATDSVHACAAVGDRLDLTLARSAPFAEHPPFNYIDDTHVDFLDQGWRDVRLWIRRGKAPVLELHPDRLALDAMTPAEIVPDSAHAGDLPRECSGLELQPEGIHLLTIKAAEDGRGWILRLQETRGVPAQAVLRPGGKVDLAPHEIVTLRWDGVGRLRRCQALEQDA